MITYSLRCEPADHAFDGWFRSSEDFERQRQLKLVACPACGSSEVHKGLMAPAVSGTREAAPAPSADAAAALARLQDLAREMRARSEYVGPRFAEEARRIHYGESQARGIYGEATPPEVKSLAEEGIAALPLPPLPEDKN
ncbi:hypothetical protein GCM10011390_35390 [Aureimonas endophytica]|uniref:DUF1178 family protein n=1 Tax=Aureimonas endophytica TaxID=2027858 RepID=A0A917E9U4_9HYPH|nr:DUF1178 family protein [Aureimonas endophytica]GGE13236.1 hypothetical protein GCM10011390_35390 [Aureimonas endophytica]